MPEPADFLQAIIDGRTQDVLTLLEAGADPNAHAKGLGFPITAAAKAGRVDVIDLLLAAGAEQGEWALSRAVRDDRADVVLALIEGGVAVKGLHDACMNTAFEAARVLLEAGADAAALDDRGTTALFYAVGGNVDHPEIVRELLEAGAPLDAVDRGTGKTPLMWALFMSHAGMAKVLLDAGANPKARSKGRDSVLHLAAMRGLGDVVARALDAKVNVDLKNKEGKTPLMEAAHAGHVEVVRQLLAAGANPEAVNKRGYSVRNFGAMNDHRDEVLALLDAASADTSSP